MDLGMAHDESVVRGRRCVPDCLGRGRAGAGRGKNKPKINATARTRTVIERVRSPANRAQNARAQRPGLSPVRMMSTSCCWRYCCSYYCMHLFLHGLVRTPSSSY